MAKKTIYVPDADLDVFEQAKKYAGESISAVIVQGLKDFVKSKEKELHGYEEVILFEGKTHRDIPIGRNVKFMGKQLAEAYEDENPKNSLAKFHYYKLYLTLKGAFVLYHRVDNNPKHESIHKYDKYQSLEDLIKLNLPPALLKNIKGKIPEVTCEDLDI